jgi:hypothetical protein
MMRLLWATIDAKGASRVCIECSNFPFRASYLYQYGIRSADRAIMEEATREETDMSEQSDETLQRADPTDQGDEGGAPHLRVVHMSDTDEIGNTGEQSQPTPPPRRRLARGESGGRVRSARAQAQPEEVRERMRRAAAFFRQVKETASLSTAQIAALVEARYVRYFLAQGMSQQEAEHAARAIAPDRSLWQRFILPSQLELQADFGYNAAMEFLEACGVPISMLGEHLRIPSESAAEQLREREAEAVMLDRFRHLSPMRRRWVMESMQQYLAQQEEDERESSARRREIDRALRLPPLTDADNSTE